MAYVLLDIKQKKGQLVLAQDNGKSILIQPIFPTKVISLNKASNDRYIFLDFPSKLVNSSPELVTVSKQLNSVNSRSNLEKHDFSFVHGDKPGSFKIDIVPKPGIIRSNPPIRQPKPLPILKPANNDVNTFSYSCPRLPFAYSWQSDSPPPELDIFLSRACQHLSCTTDESIKSQAISQAIERHTAAFFLHKFRNYCKILNAPAVFEKTSNWFIIVKNLSDDEGNGEIDVLFVVDKRNKRVCRFDDDDDVNMRRRRRKRKSPVRFDSLVQRGGRYVTDDDDDDDGLLDDDDDGELEIYDYDSAFVHICTSSSSNNSNSIVPWTTTTSDFSFLPSTSFPLKISSNSFSFRGVVNTSQFNSAGSQMWKNGNSNASSSSASSSKLLNLRRSAFCNIVISRLKLKLMHKENDDEGKKRKIDDDDIDIVLYQPSSSSSSSSVQVLESSFANTMPVTQELSLWRIHVSDEVKKKRRRG